MNTLLDPMRQRRAEYEGDDAPVIDILRAGCTKATEVAEETLALAKEAARLKFFDSELRLR